jgi:hypothetical protein
MDSVPLPGVPVAEVVEVPWAEVVGLSLVEAVQAVGGYAPLETDVFGSAE